MDSTTLRIFLADDDEDDRFFFEESLAGLAFETELRTFTNGEELMNFLNSTAELPDLVFLDLNMPRKNGYICIAEMKSDVKLRDIPVIIVSTSLEKLHVNKLIKQGAEYYIKKPNELSKLGEEISQVLTSHLKSLNLEGSGKT